MKKALTNKEIADGFMWRVAKALKPKWMPGSVRVKFVEELTLLLDSMEWTAALRYAAHLGDRRNCKKSPKRKTKK